MNKVYSDSYLKSMTKDELIDILRCAEHNCRAAEERADILSFEYGYFTAHLIADGVLLSAGCTKRMLEAQAAWEESIKDEATEDYEE